MENLNIVSGQVLLKETQQPIPNLLVELMSKDVFGVFGTTGIPSTGKSIIRLGSKTTDVNGEFSIFELDDFLRAIWLECCGHLSSFHVKGRKYEYDWMDVGAPIGEDMEQTVGEVFHSGQIVLYEYDFGSTTKLEIKVLGEYPLNSNDNIVLMSRNEAPHIKCDLCGKKPAVQICSIHYGDEPQFFCTACGKKHAKTCPDFEDYSAFPVVNSPRMGVCSYLGSESIDTERDKPWNGK